MATTDIHHIVGSLAPARKAIKFLGGATDDIHQIDASGIQLVADNNATGTFTAWVNVADIAGSYCVYSAADASAVDFIDITIEAGLITVRSTLATTVTYVVQEDAVGIRQHTWFHLAVTQNNDGRGPQIYLNGKLSASTADTATTLDDWFIDHNNIDTAQIGGSKKGGGGGITLEFKGAISDFKYFSSPLTAAQVLDDFKGVSNTTNLFNHYDWDDDLVDAGSDASNATNEGGGTIFINHYSEFSSRMHFEVPTIAVTADTVVMSVNNHQGHILVIKAA